MNRKMKKIAFLLFFILVLDSFLSKDLFAGYDLPSQTILKKICSSQFGGPLARITLWRDVDGGIFYYQFQGDMSRIIHAPTIFYDRFGEEKLIIPEKPLDSKSEKFLELQEKRSKLLKGFNEEKESIFCSKINP